MTTLYHTYSTDAAARRAVGTLRATNVRTGHITLLVGRALGDARHEPAGGFAGTIAPDAPVGTYGGRVVPRRRAAGSFTGDPDRQRQGSFADTDRVNVVTYNEHTERARITGLRGARRLLARAALDDDADRALHHLRQGHAVVLAEFREPVASEPRAPLDRIARAA
jgi:hypothetical protein